MDERALYDGIVYALVALSPLVFVTLLFIAAPYGKHARDGWGPRVPFFLGWVLMECPAPIGMFALYAASGPRRASAVATTFLALWLLHYIHRTFVYAWLRRRRGRAIPIAVVAMGFTFNAVNAYANGRWLFHFAPPYPDGWLADPRFFAGAALFVAGMTVNVHADHALLRLRKPGQTGYAIPRGGLYRWVSCPNYLGELVEWAGWALATWSVAGLAFALFTAANLAPRALKSHAWYRDHFPDYPPERKALIPYVV